MADVSWSACRAGRGALVLQPARRRHHAWRRPTLPLHVCSSKNPPRWPHRPLAITTPAQPRRRSVFCGSRRPTSGIARPRQPCNCCCESPRRSRPANLQERLEQVNQTLADVGRLQAAGLGSPVSQPEVQAQRLDLEHKRIEVELTIDQLNSQLANLLGQEPPPAAQFWPDIDLKVDPAVPAVADAQSLAVVQRADLAALAPGGRFERPGDLDAMRSLLAQSHAGLGLAASGCPLIALVHVRARDDEASERQGQLLSAVADQERAARHDVAQAIAAIHADWPRSIWRVAALSFWSNTARPCGGGRKRRRRPASTPAKQRSICWRRGRTCFTM